MVKARFLKECEPKKLEIFQYTGKFNEDSIIVILDEVGKKLDEVEVPRQIKRKVINTTIEMLQNIYFHNDTEEPNFVERKSNKSYFSVSLVDDILVLETGNIIRSLLSSELQFKINQINSLASEELKFMYRNILSNCEYSDKGGAGLGLVNIVRKTGEKLEYEFSTYDNNFNFFTLKAKLNLKKLAVHE